MAGRMPTVVGGKAAQRRAAKEAALRQARLAAQRRSVSSARRAAQHKRQPVRRARTQANALRARTARSTSGIPGPPPHSGGTTSRASAIGQKTANWVRKNPGKTMSLIGGVYTAGAVVRSSGRPVDKTRGRPTGMYGF